MNYNPKSKFFFFLIIHLFALDAKTSLIQLNFTDSSDASESPTVPLHFSHLQSPIIRNMGYCQLTLFESNTETLHDLPLFNIHKRLSRLSPTERKALKELLTKTNEPLKSPRTQPYERDYAIPRELLCPGNSLFISFFQESVYYTPCHSQENLYMPWQDLKDVEIIDFTSIFPEKIWKDVISLSLTINWNIQSSC